MNAAAMTPHALTADPLRIVSAKETAAILGYSQRTLRRKVADGLLPMPLKFGHRTRGWFAFEVTAILDAMLRGATEEQCRVAVKRIVANRFEAPIMTAPAVLSPAQLFPAPRVIRAIK